MDLLAHFRAWELRREVAILSGGRSRSSALALLRGLCDWSPPKRLGYRISAAQNRIMKNACFANKASGTIATFEILGPRN
jgi:hypothetical protein